MTCYGRVISDLDQLHTSPRATTPWPKAVAGTLLALRSIDVAKPNPEEQALISNRFPFQDRCAIVFF